MKPGRKVPIAMAMLLMMITAVQGVSQKNSLPEKQDLQLLCTPELNSLAKQMAEEFRKVYDEVKISVTTLNGSKEMSYPGSIALVDKEYVSALDGGSYFRLVLGRDAIVPVINANHPQKEFILQHGISVDGFSRIYTVSGNQKWGAVLETEGQNQVHCYIPEKQSDKAYLAEYLQTGSENLHGIEVSGSTEMISRIISDRNAIGFCSLASIGSMQNNVEDEGICLVPIDMDGNGQLNHFEDIYTDYSTLAHGIYVGKFPRALYSRIYAVSSERPAAAAEMVFLEWLISGGQETLASAGMVKLGYGERFSGMERLAGTVSILSDVPVKAARTGGFLKVTGLIVLFVLLLMLVVRTYRRKFGIQPGFATSGLTPMGESLFSFPEGLFFDKTHTWSFMEKSGHVRIGIDDFLQQVTGPLSRVVMKKPGEQLTRGESFLTLIQNGKRIDIKSPISGVVVAQNEELLASALLLNSDPYSEGWVCLVKPVNWAVELKAYFMGAPYGEWLSEEVTRLKAFISSVTKLQEHGEPLIVMQDGGELSKHILQVFGPEVWEEFQTNFIDVSN